MHFLLLLLELHGLQHVLMTDEAQLLHLKCAGCLACKCSALSPTIL